MSPRAAVLGVRMIPFTTPRNTEPYDVMAEAAARKALAKEWGRYNVNVNNGDGTIDVAGKEIKVGVNPNLLAAMEQMVPLGRGGTPVEAAGAVYLFCVPESDYVSAQTLVCSGGFSFQGGRW
jgi:NAD(P)-dependent dehydrogenase (short-subunit alcohol dehydrogenase family)